MVGVNARTAAAMTVTVNTQTTHKGYRSKVHVVVINHLERRLL